MGRIKPGLPAQMNICTIFHLAYKDLRKGDYTSFVPESYFPIFFFFFSVILISFKVFAFVFAF